MTEAHKKAIARSTTQLENYVPGVAVAMREKGILSLGELWEAIKPHVAADPVFFKNVTYANVNQMARTERTQAYKETDYSRTSYAIAAALDKSVEEVFGPLPEFRPVINSKEDAKDAFNIWGDPYSRAENGLNAKRDREDLSNLLDANLDRLSEQQQDVLKSFFGLATDPESGEEIAQRYDVSKQYISKVLQSGLEQLKQKKSVRNLRPYLYEPPVL